MVEMAECARILHLATRRSLLVLDEVGRGTSTFDGLAIAWAVAEHIHDVLGARTLFATHYHELCDLAAEKPRAVNLTMAVTEVEGQVVFLRKIVAGAASRSYGIQVAKLAGLPERVLRRAREILHNLEAQEPADHRHAPRAQMGLFEPPPPAPPPPSALEDALRKLELSRMTPLEALNWLAAQQKKLS
jgi:DNA mismatch repair protein MutS